MRDPVITPDGQTYEQDNIKRYLLKYNNLCPITRVPLDLKKLVPNRVVRSAVEEMKKMEKNNCKSYLNHLLIMVVATTDTKCQDVVDAEFKAKVIEAIVDNITPTLPDITTRNKVTPKNDDDQPCSCCNRFVSVPISEDTHVLLEYIWCSACGLRLYHVTVCTRVKRQDFGGFRAAPAVFLLQHEKQNVSPFLSYMTDMLLRLHSQVVISKKFEAYSRFCVFPPLQLHQELLRDSTYQEKLPEDTRRFDPWYMASSNDEMPNV